MSNMKKRMLSLAVAAMMIFTCIPAMTAPVAASSEEPAAVETGVSEVSTESSEVAGGNCGTNATWSLDSDGLLTISGSGTVSAGGEWPANDVKSVIIEEGITEIEGYSFDWHSNLTSIVLPESLQKIGPNAFENSPQLTNVTVPEGVTSIGYTAFMKCSGLTEITIPASVTEIGYSAFSGCSNLKTATILGQIETVPNGMFSGCSNLEKVVLPDSVKVIDNSAFSYCSKLTDINIPEGLTFIGSYAFQSCSGLTEIMIPASQTVIGDRTFYGCSGLTEIVIPDGVTEIGYNAFAYCRNLKKIEIPDSVTKIGSSAFSNCEALTELELPEGLTAIASHTFDECTALETINIPEGVTTIGEWAFTNCDSLKEIVLPEGVTSIGSHAFRSCNNLSSVNLPDSVKTIGSSALAGCFALTELELPEGLETLGNECLGSCTGIKTLVLPDGIKSIGNDAFYAMSGSLVIYANKGTVGYEYCAVNKPNNIRTIYEVTLNKTSLDMFRTTEDQLTASFTKYGEAVEEDIDIIWTSSDENIVTVSENGLVKAVGNGTAVVRAQLSGIAAYEEAVITVTTPATSVALDKAEVSLFIDDVLTLTPQLFPADTTDEVSWTSSDESVVKVAEDGSFELLKAGSAVITVNCGEAAASCSVTVGNDINNADISIGDYCEYTGASLKPAVTVKYNSKTLKEGTDYEVVCTDNINAGTAKVTVKGIGRYSGEYADSFRIIKPLTDNDVRVDLSNAVYNGQSVTKEIAVYDGSRLLTEGADYSVAYENNADAGSAAIVITGKGFYKGTVEKTFVIDKAEQPFTALISTDVIYIGKTCKVTVAGQVGTVTYTSSDPDIASVDSDGTVTGKATGKVIVTVTASGDKNYNAAAEEFVVAVYCSHDADPVESAPYKAPACETEGATAEMSCPVCGDVLVPATVIGANGHTWKTEYTVDKEPDCENGGCKSIYCSVCDTLKPDSTVTIDPDGHTWGTEYVVEKESTCTENGSKSIFCEVCGDVQEGSTASIPLTGHSYKSSLKKAAKPGANGSVVNTCTICSHKYTAAIAAPKTMTLSKTSFGYTGKVQRPKVTIKDNKGKVIPASAYKVTYSAGCKKIGKYAVKVTFKGNYTGTMSKSFKIVKGTQVISGAAKALTVGAKASLGAKRTAGNGSLSYKSSNAKVVAVTSKGKLTAKSVGTAYITVTAKATSTFNKASKKIKVTVAPKGAALSSVATNKNGEFTAKWKKAAGITGYQIRYSTSSKMTGAKAVTIGKAATVSKSVSGLSKGKKYYVQVRTYKTVKGTKYYSSWSKAKSVTTMNASLSATSLTIKKGNSSKLTVKNASGKKVKWTSSKPGVATVNSSGKVTAKAVGTATITAIAGSQKLTCKVTVNNIYTDNNLHITGKIIGETGKYASVYIIQITNQGNADLVVDGFGWIYPFGLEANTMTKTTPYYGLPPEITIGSGKTKQFYVYPERDTLISNDAEFKTQVTYKGTNYFVTIKKNGGGSYIKMQ